MLVNDCQMWLGMDILGLLQYWFTDDSVVKSKTGADMLDIKVDILTLDLLQIQPLISILTNKSTDPWNVKSWHHSNVHVSSRRFEW